MRSFPAIMSIALHAFLLLLMALLPDRASVAATKQLVEMNLVKKESPPPPPEPAEASPEPKPIPPPDVKPKLVKKKTVEKVVTDEPKRVEEESKPKIPPKGFSIDMSSTVIGGGVAATAIEGGGNMFADPSERSLDPGKKNTGPQESSKDTGKGGGTAPKGAYQITKRPEFTCSERDRTPPYPPDARAREIEGQVLLKVFVDERGKVGEVRLIRRLDPSCDAIALRWAKERFRFTPAMAGEEPVGMWIDVPVTFVIDR